jgi:hypothetical protein
MIKAVFARLHFTNKEYTRGDVTLNTAEFSCPFLKRGLVATCHHVIGQHHQRYINEFVFVGILSVNSDFPRLSPRPPRRSRLPGGA